MLLAGLFALALLYTLYFAAAIFIPIALALLLNLLLAPAVAALVKLRIPAPLGAAVVLVLMTLALVGATVKLSEPATTWIDRGPDSLRLLEYKVRSIQETVEEVKRTTAKVEELTTIDENDGKQEVIVQGPSLTEALVSGTWQFAASAMMTLVLLYFLLSTGDTFLRKVIKISPTFKDKRNILSIARKTQKEISNYLITITIINTLLGTIVGIALYLLEVPNPVLWGVLAGLLNYIPYLGPLATLGTLFLVSLITFNAWVDILLPPAVFLCLTALEGQFVTPSLVGRRLSLNPVFVFLALIVCGWIWGIFGLFLAVPLLVTSKIICDHVEILSPWGEFLSSKIQR